MDQAEWEDSLSGKPDLRPYAGRSGRAVNTLAPSVMEAPDEASSALSQVKCFTQRQQKITVKKAMHNAIMASCHYFNFLSALDENDIVRKIVHCVCRCVTGLCYVFAG